MLNSTLFDLTVFIFLIALILSIYKKSLPYSQKYESIVFITIVIYRITTYTYLLLGGKFGDHATNMFAFDHKWIGAILVPIALIFLPQNSQKNARATILGLGTGMIIDEISEVLQIAGFAMPPYFRDSFADLGLIAVTFAIFILSRRLLVKSVR